MNIKKTLSAMLAASMALSLASFSAFAEDAVIAEDNITGEELVLDLTDVTPVAGPTAADRTGTITPLTSTVVDEDGELYSSKGSTKVSSSNGSLSIDPIKPSSTIYVKIDEAGTLTNDRGQVVDVEDLANDKLFSVSYDKKTNSKLVKSMEVVTDKTIGNLGRHDWVKIVLNDATMTSEQKFEGSITFKAKKSSSSAAGNNGFTSDNTYVGDTYKLNLNLWVNNEKITDGDNPETGDRVFFEPNENDTNSLVWGDDRAALKFEANNNADKFYARLSTKSDSNIYATYGDPINADLYFYDFVGNPTIPSTSRATLTLGIPWDDDTTTDPESCFIYQVNADNELTDVTNQFTFGEDETDIEGWSIKTRTLGTYVISDTELDIEQESSKAPTESKPESNGDKDIPNTGASDMVNVAVALGSLSLAAAAAVTLRKKK